jgi:hypothetical protein
MAKAYDDEPEHQVFEGRGETAEKAFQRCAESAIRADERNHGAVFQVVRYEVVVENPRISEYRISIMK